MCICGNHCACVFTLHACHNLYVFVNARQNLSKHAPLQTCHFIPPQTDHNSIASPAEPDGEKMKNV